MKLAFLGFGNVGRGLAQLLLDKRDYLKSRYDFDFSVVGIYDITKGGIIADDIDLEKVLELDAAGALLSDYPGGTDNMNSLGLIEKSNADVLIEMTFTDLETGEPAVSHCRQALSSGLHVITSNKGPAALARNDLWQLALDNGVHFRFEGSVMSGTPVVSLLTSSLAGAEIRGFRGILNGTCNYILARMEEGKNYGDALRQAQELGYAEANPTYDVDGWDAAAKGVILAKSILNTALPLKNVPREGISSLKPADIQSALKEGKRWKMVVECTIEGNSADLSVKPVLLDMTDPLASVSETTNALTINTDVLGDVTIIGKGAGRRETGFAILSDLLWIHNRLRGKAY